MASLVPSFLHGYLSEPRVPHALARGPRDWALAAVASIAAVVEATLRTDDGWTDLPLGWQIAAVVVFLATLPPALLVRRQHPLLAMIGGFGGIITFGIVLAVTEGAFDGLFAGGAVMIVAYALYRWGSGREGAIGAVVLLVAWVSGSLTTTDMGLDDWIGGFVVLSIPVELGLLVRYRGAARERAIREAQAHERGAIARELHDTVAHHVSAIAVQAQAGRAVAATDPDRALSVLAVVEEQASRTLAEMRAMVGALRHDDDAELAPQQGIDDLPGLASTVPPGLAFTVDVDEQLGEVGPAVGAAIYRIAQEAVTNTVRHARQATQVGVTVVGDGDRVRLTVVDDGRGGEATATGYGLLGMAERAHLLGGAFSGGPDGGHGWRVAADLPRSEAVR